MRQLWSEDAASFHGEFVNFDAAKCYPKPARGGRLPIVFGGESGPALKRTADIGNGWFGFNVGPDEAAPLVNQLHTMLKANGRDTHEVEIILCPYTKKVTADDLKKYAGAGVNKFVMLATPPEDESQIGGWIDRLARDWIEPAAKLR